MEEGRVVEGHQEPAVQELLAKKLKFLEWLFKVQPPWPVGAFPGLTSSEVSALFSCCLFTTQVLRFSLGAGFH